MLPLLSTQDDKREPTTSVRPRAEAFKETFESFPERLRASVLVTSWRNSAISVRAVLSVVFDAVKVLDVRLMSSALITAFELSMTAPDDMFPSVKEPPFRSITPFPEQLPIYALPEFCIN